MSDENNLVWVNKKTNKIATKSELADMWETPKHDFELKEVHQEEIDNNTQNKDQTTINLQNNLKINDSTQIILGLLSPLMITFSLILFFPPCLFWCSNSGGGPLIPICCSHLIIILATYNFAPKFSLWFIISIIPSFFLAFFLWVNM